ncbi:MAG: class II aldolase/adducin family protein [Nitrososphaerales archaeon]
MSNIEDIKKDLIHGSRILWNEEIFSKFPFGHLSARHPDGDKFIISCSVHDEGRHLGEVVMDDLQVLDFEHKIIEGSTKESFEELFIHSEIYKARQDVNAIAHVHPITAKSLVAARAKIVPVLSQAARQISDGVNIFEGLDGKPSLITTRELGVGLAKTLGNAKAVATRGVGIDVTGPTIENAVLAAIALEENSKMQLMASQVGTPVLYERSGAPRGHHSPPAESGERRRDLLWVFFMRRLMKSEYAINL